MQAAGMGLKLFSFFGQSKALAAGQNLNQAEFDFNLEFLKTQAEEGSLEEMKQLRQAMGSQIAIQAARGTRTDAGNAISIDQENIQKFQADERARKLNLLAGEMKLRSQKTIGDLHTIEARTKLETSLAKSAFDTFANRGNLSSLSKAASPLAQKFGFTEARV